MRFWPTVVTLLVYSCFALSLSAEPLEKAILARNEISIGESFLRNSLTLMEGEMLRLEVDKTHPAQFTYIDIATGERFLGDPKDPQADQVLDYDPRTDLAIVSNGDGRWVAKSVESGDSLVAFDPELSLREIKMDASGTHAIAVGYDYRQVGLTVRAFELATGEKAWETLFPNTSQFQITADRLRFCVFKEDNILSAEFLELFDSLSGDLVIRVNLTEEGANGSVSPTPRLSKDGRYAYLRQSAPTKTWLVDIEEGTVVDLGMAFMIETSDDSRYAIDLLQNQWRILAYADASPVFVQSVEDGPKPVFLPESDRAIYYDLDTHSLLELNLLLTSTELMVALPEAVGVPTQLEMTENGRFVAVLDKESRVHVLDTLTSSLVSGDQPFTTVGFLAIAEQSGRIVLANFFGRVVSLLIDDLSEVSEIAQESAELVRFTDDEDLVAVFSSGRVETYDGASLEKESVWEFDSPLSRRYVALAADVPYLVAQGQDSLEVVNYELDEVVYSYLVNPRLEGVLDTTLSGSGTYLVIESASGVYPNYEFKLEVIRVETGEVVLEVLEDAQSILSPVFSAVGETFSFIKGLELNEIEVWTYSLEDGSLLSKSEPEAGGGSLCLNEAGTYAYYTSFFALRKVDFANGSVSDVADFSGIVRGGIQHLSLSSDESFVVLVDYNHEAILYDLDAGEVVSRTPSEWLNNDEFISFDFDNTLEVKSDGSGFIYGNGDGSFRFWDLLNVKGMVPLAAFVNQAEVYAEYPLVKGNGYRVERSVDLIDWTSSVPLFGTSAPADGVEAVSVTTESSSYLRVWEYE